ncbi:MAG: hypothetical protein WD716_11135 [Fimbriimonadaceae bacterium]
MSPEWKRRAVAAHSVAMGGAIIGGGLMVYTDAEMVGLVLIFLGAVLAAVIMTKKPRPEE